MNDARFILHCILFLLLLSGLFWLVEVVVEGRW